MIITGPNSRPTAAVPTRWDATTPPLGLSSDGSTTLSPSTAGLRNGGSIVNVFNSWRGIASRGYGVYGATTAATDVLTRSLALELRERNITVNAVALGIDAVAVPHGIAEFIAYLLGADGHRLTGQVIFGDELDGRGPPSVHRPP
jgi:NAD(P)-dependent dehydrogenase (short-subunit alcohol dehydrogenase family)